MTAPTLNHTIATEQLDGDNATLNLGTGNIVTVEVGESNAGYPPTLNIGTGNIVTLSSPPAGSAGFDVNVTGSGDILKGHLATELQAVNLDIALLAIHRLHR
jgi:hypothetical protein